MLFRMNSPVFSGTPYFVYEVCLLWLGRESLFEVFQVLGTLPHCGLKNKASVRVESVMVNIRAAAQRDVDMLANFNKLSC
jgi:hypothetical protein